MIYELAWGYLWIDEGDEFLKNSGTKAMDTKYSNTLEAREDKSDRDLKHACLP